MRSHNNGYSIFLFYAKVSQKKNSSLDVQVNSANHKEAYIQKNKKNMLCGFFGEFLQRGDITTSHSNFSAFEQKMFRATVKLLLFLRTGTEIKLKVFNLNIHVK